MKSDNKSNFIKTLTPALFLLLILPALSEAKCYINGNLSPQYACDQRDKAKMESSTSAVSPSSSQSEESGYDPYAVERLGTQSPSHDEQYEDYQNRTPSENTGVR